MCLIIEVVLLTELLCQVCRRVTLVHDDALLLVRAQIDVDEEKGRVRIIEVIFFLFFFGPVESILLLFTCVDLLLLLVCIKLSLLFGVDQLG